LRFTGANNHWVSTGSKITATNFTVEAWVRPASYEAENRIVAQYAGKPGRMIVAIRQKQLGLFIGDGGSWLETGGGDIPTNAWTHVAAVRDGSTWTLYVNGAVDKTATGKPVIAVQQDATIAIGHCQVGNTGFPSFKGAISDVRVWNRSRTQTEIADSRNRRLTGLENGLAGYWPLWEGQGTTTSNLLAGASAAAITGAAWLYDADLTLTASSDSAWNAASGDWTTAANWLNLDVPNGTGDAAVFTNAPALPPVTVNNDVAGLTLGCLSFGGAGTYTVSGNGITLDNVGVPAFLLTAGGTQTVASALAGTNGVIVNPVTGGGSLALTGASTYTGATWLRGGTLRLASLTDGGTAGPLGAASADASNIVIGAGTLHLTAASVATDRGLTLSPGNSPFRAATIRTDGDVALYGKVNNTAGALIKSGAGTLSLRHPGYQVLSATGTYWPANEYQPQQANGDSPVKGFSGVNVNAGKLILGAPGQTNAIACRFLVGLYTATNACAETAGEVEIVDGVTAVNSNIGIGWNNGTTLTAGEAGLASGITVSGGKLSCAVMSVGMQNQSFTNYNARPFFRQTGGEVELASSLVAAESWSLKPAAVTIGGGRFTAKGADNGRSLRIGEGGAASLMISGSAEVTAISTAYPVGLGVFSAGNGTLRLDGGRLTACNITRGSGAATLYWNGGTFRPNVSGLTLAGLTAAYVSAGGAVIDTSLGDYTVFQKLEADPVSAGGGLVKLGDTTLAFTSTNSTYAGATVVSNGTFLLKAALPGSGALVADGATLTAGGTSTSAWTVASLTLKAGGRARFAFADDASSNDRLACGDIVFDAGSAVALCQSGTDLPFTRNGTYTLFTYTGSDPAAQNLAVANPAFGKTYSISAAGGSVTVTIGLDSATSPVWNVDASGSWATAANWSTPPATAAGAAVRFDDKITGPVTVSTAGETVGRLFFNNAKAYTLSGSGLTLDNGGSGASVAIESGTHVVSAPLTLAEDLRVDLSTGARLNLGTMSGASATLSAQGNGTLCLDSAPAVGALSLNIASLVLSNAMSLTQPVALGRPMTVEPAAGTASEFSGTLSGPAKLTKTGDSRLTLSGDNTYSGGIAVNGGTLVVPTLADAGSACAIGTAAAGSENIDLGAGTLHYTGPARAINRGMRANAGSKKASVLRLDSDLTLSGDFRANGAFVKTGPGTLTLTNLRTNWLSSTACDNAFAKQNPTASGTSPTVGTGAVTVNDGALVLGLQEQATNSAGQRFVVNGGRLLIGAWTENGPANETAGRVVVNSGTLEVNATLGIGWQNGTSGLQSALVVNGGRLEGDTVLSLGLNNASLSSYNARPRFEQNGGSVSVKWMNLAEVSGSHPEATLNGGTFMTRQEFESGVGFMVGYKGDAVLTVASNAQVTSASGVKLSHESGSAGRLNLKGGTLTVKNIVGGAGQSTIFFGGGTLCPNAAGQTMGGLTAAYVSTNGAVIDTSLAGFTVSQALLADPHATEDGGLVKRGTNTLTLTATGSTFLGPLTVEAGTLAATVCRTNDLFVAQGAAFNARGATAVVGNLCGLGALSNGTVAVAGRLAPGTNGVPANLALTAENLTLLAGATLACDWTGAVGAVTNNKTVVTGDLAAQAGGHIDFGRAEENPLPIPFKATLMTYGGTFGGTFAGWKAKNTGVARKNLATLVKAENGLVTVEVKIAGTILTLQ